MGNLLTLHEHVCSHPFILVLMLMLRNQLDGLYYTECAQLA